MIAKVMLCSERDKGTAFLYRNGVEKGWREGCPH